MRLLLTLTLLWPLAAQSDILYVRAGASGNGSDWANALGALPAQPARGNTYYIAAGSYGAWNLGTPASGTTYITIKKATAADHGTSAGWNASYADQATISGISFNSDYWIVDGQTRNQFDWTQTSAYGFKLANCTDITIGGGVGNIIGRYMDIGAAGCVTGHAAIRSSNFNQGYAHNLLFTHMHLHDSGIPVFSNFTRDFTLSFSWVARGYEKEVIRHQYGEGWKIHNCVFVDHGNGSGANAGLTAVIGLFNYGGGGADPADTGADNGEVVGCLFYRTTFNPTCFIQDALVQIVANNWKIYNNTVVDPFSSGHDGYFHLTGSGNVARNNLIYNATTIAFGPNLTEDRTWVNPNPGGLEGTVYVGTENPFENAAGYNFRLKSVFSGVSPKDVGVNLGAGSDTNAPWNVDLDGVLRGQNGAWDIGAYEFGGTPPEPTRPTITSGDATFTNQTAGSYQITVDQPTGTTYGASNLPSGLSVSVNSGLVSGTPSAVTTNSVILWATNSVGYTNKTITMTVIPQQPVQWVSVSSLDFGLLRTNRFADLTFVISNRGPSGTILSGAVSNTASPFSIQTSPATYTLSNTQTKTITMRYAPTSVAIDSSTVAVAGNAQSNYVALAGRAAPTLTGTNWTMTSALLIPPMVSNQNNYISLQSGDQSLPGPGGAVWFYDQASSTTGKFWATIIATNVASQATTAFENVSSEYAESVSTGETTSHTITNTLADGYAVVIYGLWDVADGNITAATFDGSAMTEIARHNQDFFGEHRVIIYGLPVGNKTAGTYTVAMTSDQGIDVYNCGVMTFSGIHQSDSIGASFDAVGTSTTASVAMASAVGEIVVGGVIKGGGGTPTATPLAGETERFELSGGADTETLWGATEPGTNTMTFGATLSQSATWTMTAVPLRPSTNAVAPSAAFAVNAYPVDPTNVWTISPLVTNWTPRAYIHQDETLTNSFTLGTSNIIYLIGLEQDVKVRDFNYQADAPPGTDETPPTISISSPTNGAIYATDSTPLASFSGAAGDNVGVSLVVVTNTATGFKPVVTGTTSWSAAAIPLASGTNVISATAVDSQLNQATATLTVIYTPPSAPAPAAAAELNVNRLWKR